MSTMSTPNAKICPRCGHVVPAGRGVCERCGRLFRTPFGEAFDPNKTQMFYNGSFPVLPPPPAPPLPRVLRVRRWVQRLRQRARGILSHFART